jgi:hypothetical protein
MLAFALQHRTAIDEITGNKTANLRQYELNDTEWRIGEQLVDTLKVRTHMFRTFTHVCSDVLVSSDLLGPLLTDPSMPADIQGRDTVLFSVNAQPRDCDSCDGSHR